MRTPRLDRRLELQERHRLPDGAGGFVETWIPLGQLWGEVVPGTGRDGQAELLPSGELALRITVRAAPMGAPARVQAGQRLIEDSRCYRITTVAEHGPMYLICHAREEAVQ